MLRVKRSLLATDFNPSKIPGLVLWLEPSLGGVYSGNAAQFTSANSESLSIADNAALSVADVDFWMACWVYLDTVTAARSLIAKGAAGGNPEYALFYSQSSNAFRFKVYNGTTAHTVGTTAPSTGTWYFVLAWNDSTADTLNIQVGTAASESVAHTGGSTDSTNAFVLGSSADNLYHDGRLDSVAFGTSPVGGVSGLISTISSRLYNGGFGLRYEELSSAEKTAWGLVSYWDLEEVSGTRNDKHGSNNLTDNNTVTSAAGVSLSSAVNNDPIRQVNDLSGLGNHATQTPGTAQPLKIDNGVAGLPVIRFDGSSDYMTTATLKPAAVAQPTTIIAVTKVAAVAAASVIFDGVGTRQYLFKNGGSATGGAFYGAATQVTGEDPHTWGSFEVYTCVFNNTSSVLYINGVTKGTGTAGTVALTRVILGDNGTPGSAPANMDLACLLAYGGVLSMTQLRQLNHYFGSRYGIKVS